MIEAAKRGRLDQMIFFSAPLTTRAPLGRPAGRPAERPAGRPLTTRAPPTTVFLNLKNPKNFNLLKNSIYSDHPLSWFKLCLYVSHVYQQGMLLHNVIYIECLIILMDSRRRLKCKFAIFKIMDRRKFWLGGAAPQTHWVLAGGSTLAQTPPPERPSLAFDRGGQTWPTGLSIKPGLDYTFVGW